MTVTAVLGGFALLAIVVLAYVVGRLQSDVRRLTSDLGEMRGRADDAEAVAVDAPPAVPVAVEPLQPAAAVVVAPPSEAADDGLAVPLITRLSVGDDVDLRTSRVASVTLARPLIKVAALSYGVRRALGDEHRFRIRYEMHRELKRQRKMRRRRRSGQAPSMGWRR